MNKLIKLYKQCYIINIMFVYQINQLTDYNNINFRLRKTTASQIYISHTILKYLNSSKKKIDEYPDLWSNIKKHTNEYEYIHTPLNPEP